MSFFITDALAAPATAPAAQNGAMGSIIMLVGFVLIFYFLLWRPQSKKAKEQRDLISSLNKGDEVITNGGMLGRITKVGDDFLSLTIAEGVEIKIQKSAVTAVVPKGTVKSV